MLLVSDRHLVLLQNPLLFPRQLLRPDPSRPKVLVGEHGRPRALLDGVLPPPGADSIAVGVPQRHLAGHVGLPLHPGIRLNVSRVDALFLGGGKGPVHEAGLHVGRLRYHTECLGHRRARKGPFGAHLCPLLTPHRVLTPPREAVPPEQLIGRVPCNHPLHAKRLCLVQRRGHHHRVAQLHAVECLQSLDTELEMLAHQVIQRYLNDVVLQIVQLCDLGGIWAVRRRLRVPRQDRDGMPEGDSGLLGGLGDGGGVDPPREDQRARASIRSSPSLCDIFEGTDQDRAAGCPELRGAAVHRFP
mmetsp:Transcript_33489/g.84651  ORF Transcript_33489/g.84651 Transcript_33489/m.84651 type:complete len:301 (-) Transcript_33489:54-956(-)